LPPLRADQGAREDERAEHDAHREHRHERPQRRPQSVAQDELTRVHDREGIAACPPAPCG
jgi:hypothetical protein